MGNCVPIEFSCLRKTPKRTRKVTSDVAKRRQREIAAFERQNQGQDKKSSKSSSTSNQDDNGSEDVCYTVINHGPYRRSSRSSNDDAYENIDSHTKRVKQFRDESETEYALLRTTVAARPSCTHEPDYELVLPY